MNMYPEWIEKFGDWCYENDIGIDSIHEDHIDICPYNISIDQLVDLKEFFPEYQFNIRLIISDIVVYRIYLERDE